MPKNLVFSRQKSIKHEHRSKSVGRFHQRRFLPDHQIKGKIVFLLSDDENEGSLKNGETWRSHLTQGLFQTKGFMVKSFITKTGDQISISFSASPRASFALTAWLNLSIIFLI